MTRIVTTSILALAGWLSLSAITAAEPGEQSLDNPSQLSDFFWNGPEERQAKPAPVKPVAARKSSGQEEQAADLLNLPVDASTPAPFGDFGLPQPAYQASVGSQTASLSVDWVTPENILIGQEEMFELVLRNHGQVTIHGLIIEEALPEGFRLVKADPQPVEGAAKPTWKVARLDPQEETRIALRMVPEKVGAAQSHARVVFNTASAAAFNVVEPKLALKAEGPAETLIGGQAVFYLTVHNPGSGKTTNTVVKANLPQGLSAPGEALEYQLGALNPGETRSVRVVAKVNQLGQHECKFTASADHGLSDEAEVSVKGLGAKLDLAIDGSAFRYVSRPAQYNLRLKNTGTADAHNVNVKVRVPKAFAYLEADRTGRYDSATKYINWFVGDLKVGEEFRGEFTLRAEDQGEFPIEANAQAERGQHAEARHITEVEGIAAILLEVVDVDDPIEVGATTFYEILVTNQGTDFAKNVSISATAPEGMTIVNTQGPSGGDVNGQTVTFQPLEKLAPRADAVYRVQVRTDAPGDQRIEVRAQSDTLEAPVTELESTKVYQDQ